jgi:hypothetical protein
MPLTYVLVGLQPDLLTKVRRESRRVKKSRAGLIRQALQEHFIRVEMDETARQEIHTQTQAQAARRR